MSAASASVRFVRVDPETGIVKEAGGRTDLAAYREMSRRRTGYRIPADGYEPAIGDTIDPARVVLDLPASET